MSFLLLFLSEKSCYYTSIHIYFCGVCTGSRGGMTPRILAGPTLDPTFHALIAAAWVSKVAQIKLMK